MDAKEKKDYPECNRSISQALIMWGCISVFKKRISSSVIAQKSTFRFQSSIFRLHLFGTSNRTMQSLQSMFCTLHRYLCNVLGKYLVPDWYACSPDLFPVENMWVFWNKRATVTTLHYCTAERNTWENSPLGILNTITFNFCDKDHFFTFIVWMVLYLQWKNNSKVITVRHKVIKHHHIW